MPRAALAFALLALVALVGAAPASAHRPAPKRPAVRVVSHGDRIPGDADPDLQSVTLPRPASAYSASDTTTLTCDLKPLVTSGTPSCPTIPSTPGPSCTRDFLVFADGVYKGDGVTGVATRRTDPTAG